MQLKINILKKKHNLFLLYLKHMQVFTKIITIE